MLSYQQGVTSTVEPTTSRSVKVGGRVDTYFSADIETDGPIPGPYSMLSFAIVYAGTFDGNIFTRPRFC